VLRNSDASQYGSHANQTKKAGGEEIHAKSDETGLDRAASGQGGLTNDELADVSGGTNVKKMKIKGVVTRRDADTFTT
jgi:hypothetical protein